MKMRALSVAASIVLAVIIITGLSAQSYLGQISTDRLLGRDSPGEGGLEQITVGGGLEFTGAGDIQRSELTGDVTAPAGSNATDIDELAVEAELESVLDLADLQGDLPLGTKTSGNYVANIADGTGIDGTASAEGATYTPTLDLTEISSAIWGAGAFTSFTFDAGAVDPVITLGSGIVTWSGITVFNLDNEAELRLFEADGNGANYIGFKAPAALTTSVTCTLENDANPIPDSCVGDGSDANTLGPDGDKGDITVGGTGTTLQIDANAVGDAELRDSAALSVIGRAANSIGDPGDIAAGTDHQVLRRSGTALGFGAVALDQSAAVTGQLALANGGTGASLSDPGADRILFWDESGNTTAFATATNGLELSTTNLQVTSNQRTDAIEFVIDGGGSAITGGVKGYLQVPYGGTITAARLLADQSGSIVVDIWKDTYANYPPVDADSITSATPPTISAAVKSEDTTLSGWTTSISAGDILGFNVDSASTITRVTVVLVVTKS